MATTSGTVLYEAKNAATGDVYIGMSRDLKRRIAGHFSAARRGVRNRFYNAIRKYGEAAFTFSVLAVFNSREAAAEADKCNLYGKRFSHANY